MLIVILGNNDKEKSLYMLSTDNLVCVNIFCPQFAEPMDIEPMDKEGWLLLGSSPGHLAACLLGVLKGHVQVWETSVSAA